MIKWNASKEDREKIREIARKFSNIYRKSVPFLPFCLTDIQMSVEAAHLFEPLDLDKLASFAEKDIFSFVHDVDGIHRNVSHESGELENCFSPRCGLRKKEIE